MPSNTPTPTVPVRSTLNSPRKTTIWCCRSPMTASASTRSPTRAPPAWGNASSAPWPPSSRPASSAIRPMPAPGSCCGLPVSTSRPRNPAVRRRASRDRLDQPSVDGDVGVLDDLGPLDNVRLQDSKKLLGRGNERLGALSSKKIDHLRGTENAGNIAVDLAHYRHVGSCRRQNSPPGIYVEARYSRFGHRRNLRCYSDTPRAADGNCANISAPDHLQYGWDAAECRVDLSPHDIRNGGSHAPVRNVQDADSGIRLEHLAEKMIDRTVAGGRVSQRAGLGPRKRNELFEVIGRKLWMNNENERSDGKRCDRLKILDRIEGNLGIEAGIDRLRARIGHEQRIAVRRGFRDTVRPDHPSGPGGFLQNDG